MYDNVYLSAVCGDSAEVLAPVCRDGAEALSEIEKIYCIKKHEILILNGFSNIVNKFICLEIRLT